MARKVDLGKQRRWLERFEQWRQSGLSVRAFCGRHRLGEPAFYLWRRTLQQRGLLDDRHTRAKPASTSPAFLQVTVDSQSEVQAASAIEVVLPHGPVLRVRPGFDAELLRQLLAALQERPC